MDEALKTTQEATLSPGEMLTGSGFAVESDNCHWYIAECKPTKEGTVRTMLTNGGYEVFVASRFETKTYANRTRHTKEKVLIPGKVFVRTEEPKLMEIMLGYSAVWRFMLNRMAKERSFAYVPEKEMQQMQYMLGKANNPVQITAESLKIDQQVRVMRGPMEGLEGGFCRIGHSDCIVIKVTMGTTHYVYTEIPLEDIQPL